MPEQSVTNIAIFASGTGTNARKIIEHFEQIPGINVALILSNKPKAKVLDLAREYGIPSQIIDRETFYQTENILNQLRTHRIDWIILAGFLWLVPGYLVRAYPRRMINIHPALLPKYGGKGMYGMHVHRAVQDNGETQTGITIHYVDEKYDEGAVIFQAECPVDPQKDTPEDIARKVQRLEHMHFPRVIHRIIKASKDSVSA